MSASAHRFAMHTMSAADEAEWLKHMQAFTDAAIEEAAAEKVASQARKRKNAAMEAMEATERKVLL